MGAHSLFPCIPSKACTRASDECMERKMRFLFMHGYSIRDIKRANGAFMNISDKTSQKIKNMSFLCAILVVVIHVWSPQEIGSPAWWFYSLTYIRAIAVPWFFLASGYLLSGHVGEGGWWLIENKKRIRTLVVPYVLWCLIWLLYVWAITMFSNFINDHHILTNIGLDLSFLGIDPFHHPNLATLWYVRTLLIFVFLSPIFVFALRKWCTAILLLAFLKRFFYWGEWFGTWYYFIDRFIGIGFLFFFLLGIAIRLKLVSIPRFKNDALLLGLICLVLWCMLTSFQASGSTWIWIRAARRLLYPTMIVAMLYFAWCAMPAVSLPHMLTSSAFPIYLIHWFVLDFYSRILYRTPQTVLQVVARMWFGIFITIVIVLCVRRLFPRASVVLFGGR